MGGFFGFSQGAPDAASVADLPGWFLFGHPEPGRLLVDGKPDVGDGFAGCWGGGIESVFGAGTGRPDASHRRSPASLGPVTAGNSSDFWRAYFRVRDGLFGDHGQPFDQPPWGDHLDQLSVCLHSVEASDDLE